MSEPQASRPADLAVGVFVGPHGTRGEAKLRLLTEFPERVGKLKVFRLRFPDGDVEERRVEGARRHKDMFLVRLEGIDSMNAADTLRGAEVVIPADEATPLPEGRYYEYQILGLRVITPSGEELGVVREIMRTASNDVYVAGEFLIPATKDAVLEISPEKGILLVRSREYLEGEEVR